MYSVVHNYEIHLRTRMHDDFYRVALLRTACLFNLLESTGGFVGCNVFYYLKDIELYLNIDLYYWMMEMGGAVEDFFTTECMPKLFAGLQKRERSASTSTFNRRCACVFGITMTVCSLMV